jgi:hypothetical protein
MSYDQVVCVLEKFSELKRKESTQNRATYYFPNSPIRKQTVLQELYLTGNGYLYVGYLPEYHDRMDKNRLINIKTFSQHEFRSVLKKVLQSFQTTSKG